MHKCIEKSNKNFKKLRSQLDKSIEKARKKPKTINMANKLQLMRMKNKAVGLKTAPDEDQVLFIAENPKMMGNEDSLISISKTRPIGKSSVIFFT